MAAVLYVLLHEQISSAGLASQQRVLIWYRGRDQWIVSGMDRQHGTGQVPGERDVALQVSERTFVGGVALHAVVERVIIRCPGVDGVAIIERIAAGALLYVFENVREENDCAGEVAVIVNAN